MSYMRICLLLLPQFCKDVQPGSARAKDCLEENREELSEGCREEIDTMIERRVRDFRLDSRLRQACENEIFNMCAYFGVSISGWQSAGLCCLHILYKLAFMGTSCFGLCSRLVLIL